MGTWIGYSASLDMGRGQPARKQASERASVHRKRGGGKGGAGLVSLYIRRHRHNVI